jgi:hypothetical protein
MTPGMYRTPVQAARWLAVYALLSAPFWLCVYLLIARPFG